MSKIQIGKIDNVARGDILYFSYTLATGGERIYGICYRHLFRGKSRRFDAPRRTKHALCILSHRPYVYGFKSLLLNIFAVGLIEGAAGACKEFVARALHPFLTPGNSTLPCISYVHTSPYRWSFGDIEESLIIPTSERLPFREAPLLPLLTILGVDKFFKLMSALLCESRVAFVSDDPFLLSTAVTASVSLLHPFAWPHMIISFTPPHLLCSLISAREPFILGVKKEDLRELPFDAYSGVLLVDLEGGHLSGDNDVRDLVGDANTTMKQASENLDRLRAGFQSAFLGKSSGDSASSGERDLMAMLILDLKSILSNKPSQSSIQGFLRGLPVPGTGTKTDDETALIWAAESEKLLRDSVTYFFVYLFGDMEDFLSLSITPSNSALNTATSTEQQLQPRLKLDKAGFMQRRSACNIPKPLLDFLVDFTKTIIFRRFCESLMKRQEKSRNLPSSRNRGASSSASTTSTSNNNESYYNGLEVDDLYYLACSELRSKALAMTPHNAKHAVKDRTFLSWEISSMGSQYKVNHADVHNLTSLLTQGENSNAGDESAVWSEDIVVAIYDLPEAWITRVKEISLDCRNSEQCRRVWHTILHRIELGKAGIFRGSVGLAAIKAIFLLRLLLVQSQVHSLLTLSLDLIPLLRDVVKTNYVNKSQGNAMEFMSTTVQYEPRPVAYRLLSLLIDQRKLMVQQTAYLTAMTSTTGYYKTIGMSRGSSMRLGYKRGALVSAGRNGGKQFLPFASIHASFNDLQTPSIAAGILKLTTPERAVLEDPDEDQNDAVSVTGKSDSGSTHGTNTPHNSGNLSSHQQGRQQLSRPVSTDSMHSGSGAGGGVPPPKPGRRASAVQPVAAKPREVTPPPQPVFDLLDLEAEENAPYRVKDLDTGEVKDIRSYHHYPYDTFRSVLKGVRKAAAKGLGRAGRGGGTAAKGGLKPPPNDSTVRSSGRGIAATANAKPGGSDDPFSLMNSLSDPFGSPSSVPPTASTSSLKGSGSGIDELFFPTSPSFQLSPQHSQQQQQMMQQRGVPQAPPQRPIMMAPAPSQYRPAPQPPKKPVDPFADLVNLQGAGRK